MLAVLLVAPPGVQCGMERDLAIGRPGKFAGLRIERRDQSGIDLSRRCLGGNGIEPPRGPGEDPVVGIDDVRIAVGQRDGNIGIHVRGEMSGDEVGVPQVVRIEEADERCVQLGQAAPDRAALAEVRFELDVAKAAVVELRQAGADGLVGPVGRGIVDDDRADIADGLPRHRLDGLCDEVAVVVIGDDDANGGSYRHSR